MMVWMRGQLRVTMEGAKGKPEGFFGNDMEQPPSTGNPGEPYALGDKVEGTRTDGTTETLKRSPVRGGEHKDSRTPAEMALDQSLKWRTDTEQNIAHDKDEAEKADIKQEMQMVTEEGFHPDEAGVGFETIKISGLDAASPLTNRDVCDIIDYTNAEEEQMDEILKRLQLDQANVDQSRIKAALMKVSKYYKDRLNLHKRDKKKVRKSCKEFLQRPFIVEEKQTEEEAQKEGEKSIQLDAGEQHSYDIETVLPLTPPKTAAFEQAGPSNAKPKRNFEDLCERQKRRHVQELREKLSDQPFEKIMKVATQRAKSEKKKDWHALLAEAMKSPLRPSKIMSSLKSEQVEITNISAEEALAMLLCKNFTKDQYQFLRNSGKSHGLHNYYPEYKNLLTEKMLCRPREAITISDTTASISLQSLLNHTAERIIKLQTEVIRSYANMVELDEINVDFHLSWGFVGSTGQSIYKQQLKGADTDGSLFATTVIPLAMKTSDTFPIWTNKTPQSFKACRPLHLQFIKETNESILAEKLHVESEIANLQGLKYQTTNGVLVNISFKLYLTVIDGKVSSIITGATSQQSCGVCGCTPKDFNNKEKVKKSTVKPDTLKYGISPLHMWIRSFEFVLHLGYKNEDGLQKWKGNKESTQYKERKQLIQDRIKVELGLLVDIPKSGGSGSTNDGNTARRAFSDDNRDTFAEILDIEKWLLDGLHTLLVTIDSCLPIDAEKFGNFCDKLYAKYVEEYKWYYLPVSIHRLLAHGKQIVEASALPLGTLSEQGGESQNKMYKFM